MTNQSVDVEAAASSLLALVKSTTFAKPNLQTQSNICFSKNSQEHEQEHAEKMPRLINTYETVKVSDDDETRNGSSDETPSICDDVSSKRSLSSSLSSDRSELRMDEQNFDDVRSPNIVPNHDERRVSNCDKGNFLTTLMTLLKDDVHQDKLSFLSNGNSFVIHLSFATSLMPRMFNISNFRVFVRKLEQWGFTQVKQQKNTTDFFTFFHPLFRRDDPDGLYKITPRRLPRRFSCIAFPSTTNSGLSPQRDPVETLKFHRRSSTGSNLGSIQNAINRNLDISNGLQQRMQSLSNEGLNPLFLRKSSLGYHEPVPSFSQTAVNNATKNIVAAAVSCLMHDEVHTLNLLARRGHELNTTSLMNSASQGSLFQRPSLNN